MTGNNKNNATTISHRVASKSKVKKVVASLPIILKTPAMQLLGLLSMIFPSLKSATFSRDKLNHGSDVKKIGELRCEILKLLCDIFVAFCFVNVGYSDNLNRYLYQQSARHRQVKFI